MSNPEAVLKPDFSKVIREDGAILNVHAFVEILANSGLYWIVAADGVDWNFVVLRIADDFFGKDRPMPDPLVFLNGLPEEYPAYGRLLMPMPPNIHFMRKSMVPPEVLASRFGVRVAAVNAVKYISLEPTAAMRGDGLPKPTVPEALWSYALH